jgi:translation initiation factor IF-3
VMILDRLAEELSDVAVVEQRPLQDGRNMTMMLGPSKAVLSGELEAPEKDEAPVDGGGPDAAEGEVKPIDGDTPAATPKAEVEEIDPAQI